MKKITRRKRLQIVSMFCIVGLVGLVAAGYISNILSDDFVLRSDYDALILDWVPGSDLNTLMQYYDATYYPNITVQNQGDLVIAYQIRISVNLPANFFMANVSVRFYSNYTSVVWIGNEGLAYVGATVEGLTTDTLLFSIHVTNYSGDWLPPSSWSMTFTAEEP